MYPPTEYLGKTGERVREKDILVVLACFNIPSYFIDAFEYFAIIYTRYSLTLIKCYGAVVSSR